MTTDQIRPLYACTLAFDEGVAPGVLRPFTDTDRMERASIVFPRILFPDAGLGRYFKDEHDIAIIAVVPLDDPRLVRLESDPRAANAIRFACAQAFWTNAYQWEMTKAGFLRLVQNIEGLNFGLASDAMQIELERSQRHSFFTLENIIVRLVDGDDDRLRLAGVTHIDVQPDWSVREDGEVVT